MDEELMKKIMKLELEYADHKPDCEVTETKKCFQQVAKTAKDCGQSNFSMGATGVKCTCGYTELVTAIKNGLKKIFVG